MYEIRQTNFLALLSTDAVPLVVQRILFPANRLAIGDRIVYSTELVQVIMQADDAINLDYTLTWDVGLPTQETVFSEKIALIGGTNPNPQASFVLERQALLLGADGFLYQVMYDPTGNQTGGPWMLQGQSSIGPQDGALIGSLLTPLSNLANFQSTGAAPVDLTKPHTLTATIAWDTPPADPASNVEVLASRCELYQPSNGNTSNI